MTIDLEKVRKAIKPVTAGEPGELDPAVGPHGGTHDTDIEIADDVVKLVDTNSPDTPDLETRAYEGGTEDDGSADTPPYDGESSVDGIPTIPDTLATTKDELPVVPAAADDDAGSSQKNEGGGGPVVQLPDTLEDDLSVAPKDPHASVALTTDDIDDLRHIMSKKAEPNVSRAVNVLQWLDRNDKNPNRGKVQAGLDLWKPTRSQAMEAQARYGFAYLHTEASAKPANHKQTSIVLAWLKTYVTGRKLAIALNFLKSGKAKANPQLAKQIYTWYKINAVDQVRENREQVGTEDITLYGPQNESPDHRPSKENDGFTEPKVVSLDDVPFKDPERHPAEADTGRPGHTPENPGGSMSPEQDENAVDSDSFSARSDDRGKESNLPTATTTEAFGPPIPGLGCGEEIAPPVPGLPGEEELPLPPMPPMPPAVPPAPPAPVDPMAAPPAPVDPMAAPPAAPPIPGLPVDPMAPPVPGEEPMPPMPELSPVLPEEDESMGMGPGEIEMQTPGADQGGLEQTLEEWLREEMQEPMMPDPAESAHVEMLSSFDEVGQVVAADIVMSLYGAEQENPHWNIDIKGQPIARVELTDQPKPEEVRATFLSGPYAENIAKAMEKVGVAEVLKAINAKPYAAKIEAGKLAEKIRAKVEADLEVKYAEKVGELRDRFLTAAKIALAGFNNNFFRGEDHILKAALWSELARLGIRDASRAIEAGFDEGSVPFFASVLSKAEELMDLPDEARDAIAKAIPESNALVTAGAGIGDELPEHETLARKLEAANVPFEAGYAPLPGSRSDHRDGLRAKAKLSTFRSS